MTIIFDSLDHVYYRFLKIPFSQEVEPGEDEGSKGGKAELSSNPTLHCFQCWTKTLLQQWPKTLNQPLLLHSSGMPGHCCLEPWLAFFYQEGICGKKTWLLQNFHPVSLYCCTVAHSAHSAHPQCDFQDAEFSDDWCGCSWVGPMHTVVPTLWIKRQLDCFAAQGAHSVISIKMFCSWRHRHTKTGSTGTSSLTSIREKTTTPSSSRQDDFTYRK